MFWVIDGACGNAGPFPVPHLFVGPSCNQGKTAAMGAGSHTTQLTRLGSPWVLARAQLAPVLLAPTEHSAKWSCDLER